MKYYPHIDEAEIERQYYLRGLRPDYDSTVLPDWLSRSNQLLEQHSGQLDLRYGDSERNTLDFLSAKSNTRKCVLYIHGGYWQRGDKSIYRFLAKGFLDQGISVALINYPMCPDVRLGEIANHARKAALWLWNNADSLEFSKDQLNIIGHSAGGHLTAELMLTDWRQLDSSLPHHLFHSGSALSGIYDLEPLLYCSENEGLKLDNAEIKSASTINREVKSIAPMIIGYGTHEPDDMHRQSIEFSNKFSDRCTSLKMIPIEKADHFDVVNELGDTDTALFSHILDMICSP